MEEMLQQAKVAAKQSEPVFEYSLLFVDVVCFSVSFRVKSAFVDTAEELCFLPRRPLIDVDKTESIQTRLTPARAARRVECVA